MKHPAVTPYGDAGPKDYALKKESSSPIEPMVQYRHMEIKNGR